MALDLELVDGQEKYLNKPKRASVRPDRVVLVS